MHDPNVRGFDQGVRSSLRLSTERTKDLGSQIPNTGWLVWARGAVSGSVYQSRPRSLIRPMLTGPEGRYRTSPSLRTSYLRPAATPGVRALRVVSIRSCNSAFGAYPTIVVTNWPSLKIASVGMLMMP